MEFTSTRHGNITISLAKITVFLGANGAGKSSVLNEAKQHIGTICPGKKVVYIEGGRAITLQNTLQLTRHNVDQYQDFTRAKTTYEKKRQQNLSSRVYDALMMLERKELEIKALHSDRVEEWIADGQVDGCPVRETPPLERLFSLFHEIFPRLSIIYNAQTKTIKVRKGAAEYSISEMSDGEKQCFSILSDFVELDDEYGLIVVDEPELNLHPELADRIWNLIESEFPDKVYCYATHSLSFAMRPQVGRVMVLADDPENITTIEDPSEFSRLQLTEFLGSIPGIIAANNVVVTEGDEKSFDSVFYRWIVGDDQVEVMPAGDCEQVINVCRRDGIWSKIAPKVYLTGIIDRDFRSDVSSGEIQLEFREAESFLAVPALAVDADKHLSIRPDRLTEEQVIDLILAELESEKLIISANFVAARCGIRLGVSVKRSVQKSCRDRSELLDKLTESSQEELAKATSALGNAEIESMLDEIDREIEEIVSNRDWRNALVRVDGKAVGNKIAQLIGVRNAIDLMRSIAANVAVDSHDSTRSLAQQVLGTMPNKASLLTPAPPRVQSATSRSPSTSGRSLAPGQV
jgi:ABC-type cobalamin/Fe3+-siderophores transport system ATPase subunit